MLVLVLVVVTRVVVAAAAVVIVVVVWFETLDPIRGHKALARKFFYLQQQLTSLVGDDG